MNPKTLGSIAAKWQEDVSKKDDDAVRKSLIYQAAKALDRLLHASAEIDVDGITYVNSNGNIMANPATVVEKNMRDQFARLCKQLEIDKKPEEPSGPKSDPASTRSRK